MAHLPSPAHPASIFPQRLSVRPLGTSPGSPFAQTTPPGLPSTKPMCAKSFSFQPHPIPGGSPPVSPNTPHGDTRRELMAVVWLHVLCSADALQQEHSPMKGPCPLLLAGMGGGAMAVAVPGHPTWQSAHLPPLCSHQTQTLLELQRTCPG